MTYGGHSVLQTLIRCYFSPASTTGQSFIYSGSSDGSIYIWDILTGEIVKKLDGHRSIVRDVSWHPFEPLLLSASWDRSVRLWDWQATDDDDNDDKRYASGSEYQDDEGQEDDEDSDVEYIPEHSGEDDDEDEDLE
jgi:DDB1- and CUL4-associated factor 11